jgi:hypothetical protein
MTTTAKRLPLLRVLLVSHLPFTAMLFALFMAVVLVLTTILVLANADVDNIMQLASVQVPRWLLFGLGIDVVSNYLRMHLAHGRTRREFAGQALLHTVILSGSTAVLIAVGYLLEFGLHGLAKAAGRVSRMKQPYGPHDFPEILGTYWLSLLLWTVAGLVIGLGFFRSTAFGVLTIPAGVAIALPSVTTDPGAGLPFLGNVFTGLGLGAGEMIAAGAVLLVVGAGLVWAFVREVPMKAAAG